MTRACYPGRLLSYPPEALQQTSTGYHSFVLFDSMPLKRLINYAYAAFVELWRFEDGTAERKKMISNGRTNHVD